MSLKDDLKTIPHPSFGVVRLSRASGGARLVGSAVRHQTYISLSVHAAEMWESEADQGSKMFPREQLVEVHMTEAQFAEFITKWNYSEGTPCTLSRRPEPGAKLVSVEEPPVARSMRENLEALAEEAASRIGSEMQETAQAIEELVSDRLTKKGKDELRRLLSRLYNAEPNYRFAAQQMEEVVEKATARAKVEMEASARRVIESMGLGAVAEQVKAMLPQFEPEPKPARPRTWRDVEFTEAEEEDIYEEVERQVAATLKEEGEDPFSDSDHAMYLRQDIRVQVIEEFAKKKFEKEG